MLLSYTLALILSQSQESKSIDSIARLKIFTMVIALFLAACIRSFECACICVCCMRMFNTLFVVFSVSLLLICLFEVRAKPTSGQRRLDSHNKCQLFCKHRSCWLITSDTVYVTLASSSHPSTSIAASSRMVFFVCL